ncbi:hypothetical protein CI610_00003 [invertebrate metagenome]|uniref:Uncharacterized protein n=1 Tax=invertebrate metagenome TaxID=1711999 RepID=A0A2H9TCH6_9ZZZZ
MYWLEFDRYALCMDRTNWKDGGEDINYLAVSVVWQGASIPIAWVCLIKGEGNLTRRSALT